MMMSQNDWGSAAGRRRNLKSGKPFTLSFLARKPPAPGQLTNPASLPMLASFSVPVNHLITTSPSRGRGGSRRRQEAPSKERFHGSSFEGSQADTDIKTKVGNVCSQSERFRPRNLLEHMNSLQHLPHSSCHALYTHSRLQTPEHLARNRIMPIVK